MATKRLKSCDVKMASNRKRESKNGDILYNEIQMAREIFMSTFYLLYLKSDSAYKWWYYQNNLKLQGIFPRKWWNIHELENKNVNIRLTL